MEEKRRLWYGDCRLLWPANRMPGRISIRGNSKKRAHFQWFVVCTRFCELAGCTAHTYTRAQPQTHRAHKIHIYSNIHHSLHRHNSFPLRTLFIHISNIINSSRWMRAFSYRYVYELCILWHILKHWKMVMTLCEWVSVGTFFDMISSSSRFSFGWSSLNLFLCDLRDECLEFLYSCNLFVSLNGNMHMTSKRDAAKWYVNHTFWPIKTHR